MLRSIILARAALPSVNGAKCATRKRRQSVRLGRAPRLNAPVQPGRVSTLNTRSSVQSPMTQIGKRIGHRLYLHTGQLTEIESNIACLIDKASEILRRRVDARFNIVRLNENEDEIAFLDYPDLGAEPFPALANSWRVHLPSELVTHRSYTESLNPPILHRTELLLPADHPARAGLQALTDTCESVGLFKNPRLIGFRQQWDARIREKGYRLAGTELVPVGNEIPEPDGAAILFACDSKTVVDRHLTALTRNVLSAPVQSLIRDGLLTKDSSFFDYGCGKGDDLTCLQLSGFRGTGWDPHFRPGGERVAAEVVNLGFVINVIENCEERIQAIEAAYGLTTRVLAVSAMITTSGPSYGRSFSDGILTSRNTFQKYYTQTELQQFVESTLQEDAYPAAPGVFYVFRDRAAEQRYLVNRTQNRSRVARARMAHISVKPRTTSTAPPAVMSAQTAEARSCLAQLWDTCLELGRFPDATEIPNSDDVQLHFGTVKRAFSACAAHYSESVLTAARLSRQNDILVMLALHFFERRRSLNLIDPRLRRDVRAFFGSMRMAEAKAHELLFSVQDTAAIRGACEQAVSQGLGWYEAEHSLQLHTSLVERLPAILRVYIGCATALAGSLAGWDLVKIHVDSGKVTLMSFDDFSGKPLPALMTRMKVRLRDQDLDIFEYGDSYPPPSLYYKSRYINEEFPYYADQVQFEEFLDALNLFDLSGYGPSTAQLHETLYNNRWEISGFTLRRSTQIPSLSEPCGKSFRYTDLIHCGETWTTLRSDNTPRAPETYNALNDLARIVLDPVVEYFGAIKLTYGFASPALTRHIQAHIASALDQHAAHEVSKSGKPICGRLGAAVDFLVEDEDMFEVARWITENCRFDRIYYYGRNRPLHVSVGPTPAGEVYELIEKGGRRIPRRLNFDKCVT